MSLARVFKSKFFLALCLLALVTVFVAIPNGSAAAQFPTPAPDTAVTVMDVKATAQGLGMWALAILGVVIGAAITLWKRTRKG